MLKKTIQSLKKDGIFVTIKKVFMTIKYKIKFRDSYKLQKIIKNEVDISKFDTIIVFENNFGWNKIMKQRPQQIAENIPENTLMFYHSHENDDYPKNKRISKLKDNLILIDLGYYRDALLNELSSHSNKYLMIYSTDYIPYDRIKVYENYNYNILYEYVDDINEELSGREMYELLSSRHKKILNSDSFVVCTSTELYNNVLSIKGDCCRLITNGGNYDHFKVREYDIPSDLKPIRDKHDNLICYYGALASWFDYELVKKMAINKKNGIVLLGQDYDQTLEKSGILDIDNIYYLGKKDYNDLPKYGCNVDMFIIPFLINDITKSTSPVKIFEYMAMEKPIITTALPECKKYKSVLYSENHDDFIENINKALTLIDNKKYKTTLRKEAIENDWKSKALNMVEFINSANYNMTKGKINDMLNNSNYDRIIVWRSPFGWDVPLFQRPQHIARQFAKQRCLVLYEITNKTDMVNTIKKQENNLYLVNFENNYLKDILNESINLINVPKYIQIYSTNWSMSIDELKEYKANGYRILYEYIDDISPQLAGTDKLPEYVLDKYNYALKNNDVLIVTTAKELYDDVLKKRGKENLVFSCNGVDYDFFQKIDNNYKFESEFKKIITNGKINVCYYGALAKWFDYELIKKINDTNLYNIILFGIKYDDSYDKSGIAKLKNVHFLGSKDYHILKNYASKMDVLTIPFVINSITQATSPLKLFEYMALHKPIVTTAMNECKKYKSVQIAVDHNDFIKKLNDCKNLAMDEKYIKLLDKEARENDWQEKAKIIVELLEQNERN